MEEFGIDLDEVFRVIDTADVLVVRFALLDDRLLLDARQDEDSGAILKVVPRAGSLEERFKTIKQLRPSLPLPERMLSFQWPRQIETLRSSGIWQRIEDRCGAENHDDAGAMCAQAWRDLTAAERRLVAGAVAGSDGFHTLWERA